MLSFFKHPFPIFSTLHQRLRSKIVFVLIPSALTLLFFGFREAYPDFLLSTEQRFVRFTEDVFRNEMSGNTLSLHYTLADPSAYSIDRSAVSLGNIDTASRKEAFAQLENYLSALKTFDRDDLSTKRQLTYDVFYHYLETELSASDFMLYDEPLSPTLGIQAQLPILLAEYRFRTKGDIEDCLCLLSQIPDYFDSILRFEQEKAAAGLFMSKDCAEAVVRQCETFIANPETNYLITIFNEKIDQITNLTADEKISCKMRCQSLISGYVIPAYQNLITKITELSDSGKNDKGLFYLPQGQEYYRYLVRSMVGDDREIEEIEEEIKEELVEDYTAAQELLLSQDPSAGFGSAVTVSGSAASDSATAAAMLEELRQDIRSDFPLPANVSCSIKSVHESLQNYLSPAFYLTPAIDDLTNNVIYINPSAQYSDLDLFTTLAHEGYPGHLYQTVYFLETKPDLLRTILNTGGYTEGWATYVEMYSYSLWDSSPKLAALGQHNRAFTLGLASLLDIGIHYHGYTPDEVTAFLVRLGFEETTADSLYQTILQSPANYLQYYVGYLNFKRLKEQQLTMLQENFSLKNFHQQILTIGPAPFSLLENYLAIPAP